MNYSEIYRQIVEKKSFLCVGLDTDIKKIPSFLLDYDDPMFEFNRGIIDATARFAIAFKPNVAFYERGGNLGWNCLKRTIEYIRTHYPEIIVIADAKRGDIGNTSKMYADAFFHDLRAHAVTVAPYMGKDSVEPFLQYEGRWAILLALTSNQGANDFEFTVDAAGEPLFKKVLKVSQQWADKNKMMYVVGATQASMLKEIREIVPEHFLLVPGVGAQGGSLEQVAANGMNSHCGLIVNSSRGIIYADNGVCFEEAAADSASELQKEMEKLLRQGGVL